MMINKKMKESAACLACFCDSRLESDIVINEYGVVRYQRFLVSITSDRSWFPAVKQTTSITSKMYSGN